MVDRPIRSLFPDQEVEQARRQTLYLAASLQHKGFQPNLTADVAPGDSPALDYLSRYVQLVRLLAHGERLFRDVLPKLRSRLGVSTERRQEFSRLGPRGRLDITETYRRAVRRGETQPSSFAVQRAEREYATSGNQLVALTLLMIHKQVDDLVSAPRTGLTHFEKKTLHALADRALTALRQQEFQAAVAKLSQELRREPDSQAARPLEEEVERKAGRSHDVPPNYRLLVEWRRAWREYLIGATGALFKTPRLDSSDHGLYELLVLLEITTAFARRARRARQTRGRGQHGTPTFELELDDDRQIAIWFQATETHDLKRATEIKSKPDLIIELKHPKHRAVIIEAKCIWNPENKLHNSHTQAANELMAYLFNYGHPDPRKRLQGGLVVFPHSAGERHPAGYHHLVMHRSGPPRLSSLIIPITGADTACRTHLDCFADDVITGNT